MNRKLKIAFVQDALPLLGGAERVLVAAWEVFPDAPLYTLVYNKVAFDSSPFSQKTIVPSFINRLPGAGKRYRYYLPLMPLAVENFDLREYDLILSFNYAVAHGVLPRPGQLHISYTYTPMRYAWHFYHQYLREGGLRSGVKGWLVQGILHYLRLWDHAAADRVDRFIAASNWVAQGIWRAYRRPATVVYPPVATHRFSARETRGDYFITVSRLIPHKKIDLIVQAFSRLGYPLLVVGEGQEFQRLSKLAASNVKLLGWCSDDEVADLLGNARAFVQAAEEDFGIALAEAQAAGCPVIAYDNGGAREIVIPGETGLLFEEQSVESLSTAVEQFVAGDRNFIKSNISSHVDRFNKARFQQEFETLVADTWARFEEGERDPW
jgi:glycosyltransferase involved in cell wall biosynthesis